eukprot:871192_1
MSIVIAECTNIHNTILRDTSIAHIYWLLESLWTFNVNSAIVLITMRCYRVYKTTNTKFTPLKDWIANNELRIEYFLWTIYILIILFIIIQYIIIIASSPNQSFDIELSLINALRNFGTATILSCQLMIACFFFYIAHKSQQQTNWNEQSKAIIWKETAKLAFIVLFLALIVAVLLYRASWYLVHLHTHTYALHAPFKDTSHRVNWSILEFLAFWLILYLTRLRKPPSDEDQTLPSTTNTKLFLRRALSTKQDKKDALRQMKLKELEERKRAFREREKRKQYHHHKPMRTADNIFNTLFIQQVAKYEREKQANQKRLDQKVLLREIKQKKQQKRQQHTKMKQIHKELKERNSNTYIKPMHDKEMMSLDIVQDTPLDVESNQDDSPLEPIPETQQHKPIRPNEIMIDLDMGSSDSDPPEPAGGNVLDTLPNIAVIPQLYTSASGYAMTPGGETKNKFVDVVLTPHPTPHLNHKESSENGDDDDDELRICIEPKEWHLKPSISASDPDLDTTETEMDTDMQTTEDEYIDTTDEDTKKTNVGTKVTPFQSMIAKLGAVFTPRGNEDGKQTNTITMMFPSVDPDAPSPRKEGSNKRSKKPRAQTDPFTPSNGKDLYPIHDEKETLSIVEGDESENHHENSKEHLQDIVDIYLNAFKTRQKSTDDMEMEMDAAVKKKPKTPQPPPINTTGRTTQVIGEGIFHNMVHLKPMALKRSHSDPDIRSRNEIWDHLLSAFKEMNEEHRDSPIESLTRSSNQNDEYHLFMHRRTLLPKDDEVDMVNQTQLTVRDGGFQLFGFHLKHNAPKLNSKPRGKGRKIKEKMKVYARDSLQLPDPDSPVPDYFQGARSLNQPLSVRLSLDEGAHHKTDKKKSRSDRKRNGKSDRKGKQNKNGKKLKAHRVKVNKNYKKRNSVNSRSHRRSALMTSDIMKSGKQDPVHSNQVKLKRRSKIKKKKIFKMRMKQKQQTKQWMNNVRQVF